MSTDRTVSGARRRPARAVLALAGLSGVSLVALLVWWRTPSTEVEHVPISSVQEISPAGWAALQKQRIFFGHQSVGKNIFDGVRALQADDPQLALTIAELHHPADLAGPVLGHASIGRNGDPRSKLRDFAELIGGSLGDRVDLALFKFCYVDIEADTNVVSLFEEYRQTMATLGQRCPGVTFVHVTVPLCSRASGWKAWVRALIRQTDNSARCRFNELLRGEYAGRAPIFDLAACEATAPDGARTVQLAGGDRSYALLDAYTTDGGHLNEVGQRQAAIEFLKTLAQAALARNAAASAPSTSVAVGP